MSTTSIPSSPIIFYDIAPRAPVEKNAFPPNPWKSRLALNFKGLPCSTTWVPLPEIAKVRISLKVPACRKLANGTDFYTLPIIKDPATGSLVGDSFDIAVYLQSKYPDSGAGDLFPPQTLDYVLEHDLPVLVPLTEERKEFSEYAKFNTNIDAAFTAHIGLAVMGFPFDTATLEDTKAVFVRRAGVSCWEDFALVGEAREKVKDSLRNMLGGLSKLFSRDQSGPFILGTRASYADLIVGAWLRTLSVTLPENEWKELSSWHDGLFRRLHDALDVYAQVK